MRLDEFNRGIDHEIGGILFTGQSTVIALKHHLALILREIGRVVVVRVALTEVADPFIESLAGGQALGHWTSQPPLAGGERGVSLALQRGGNRFGARRQRTLATPPTVGNRRRCPRPDLAGALGPGITGQVGNLTIATNLTATGVLPGQQSASTWGTDR